MIAGNEDAVCPRLPDHRDLVAQPSLGIGTRGRRGVGHAPRVDVVAQEDDRGALGRSGSIALERTKHRLSAASGAPRIADQEECGGNLRGSGSRHRLGQRVRGAAGGKQHQRGGGPEGVNRAIPPWHTW